MALFSKWLDDNVGSTTVPITSSIANANFMGFYVSNSDATGGTARGLYMRLYLTGTSGQSGEAVRAFTTVNGTGGVGVHGIHAAVSFGTSGTITGECAAVRATLQIKNAAMTAGQKCCVQADLSADGASSSDSSGSLAAFAVTKSGDGTGAASILGTAMFLDLQNANAGSGAYFIDTSKTALTGYGSLRVKCPDGVTRYIPITSGS